MQKTKVIPVIIDATGTISKSFRKIPDRHDGKVRQGTARKSHIGIAQLLRNVRVSNYATFNVGNNSTCSIHCNYRIAATLHTLVTRFVSGL
jgi:hypothetical protein